MDAALLDVLTAQLLAQREQLDAALRLIERIREGAGQGASQGASQSPPAPVVVNNADADAADTAAALQKFRTFGGTAAGPSPSAIGTTAP
jgi:hypothetical protein